MIIDDVRFELKDGREAILRSPKEEDAESREGVMQIELEFVEGNTRARHLYEKMGFRITGVHPNAITFGNDNHYAPDLDAIAVKKLITPIYNHP